VCGVAYLGASEWSKLPSQLSQPRALQKDYRARERLERTGAAQLDVYFRGSHEVDMLAGVVKRKSNSG